MNTVGPSGPCIAGIDVSNWNQEIHWKMVRGLGYEFAFIKATEGTTLVDESFASHWAGAKAESLPRGAYHFYHSNRDPVEQANHFCKTIGEIELTDMPCVMDWETVDGLMLMTKQVQDAFIFLDTVENLTKKRPIIYGSPYFLESLGGDPELKEYPLWIAHYGVKAPLIPPPWATWSFWQENDARSLPGLGRCDTNFFNGTIEQLNTFIVESSLAPLRETQP
jgi:lysozyme